MKGATECARRLKQLVRSLRASQGKVVRPATGDPVSQLILGIFSRNAPEAKAQEALERLCSSVVDYNDLRVIDSLEMTDLVGDYPDARRKCEDLSRALNSIFAIEHTVSLERVRTLPRREGLAYLSGIDGLEPYTRARIRLQGFQQHAFPLDEAMWAYLRQHRAVDGRASLEEAQTFMERQIPEKETPELVGLLKRAAWAECAAAVRKGESPRILSVPPDRTSRNMLQMVASGAALEPPDEVTPPLDDDGRALAPSARKPKPKAKTAPAKSPAKSSPRPSRLSKRSPAKTRSA